MSGGMDHSGYGTPSRRDGAGKGPEWEDGEYQMDSHWLIKAAGGAFFACWWLFAAYMVISSHKEGLASHIAAYVFLALGLLVVVRLLVQFARAKFVVRGTAVTRYFAFAPPRTYDIRKITKVVMHTGRGGITGYRVYIGEKKIFTLDQSMLNLNFFLSALRENHVPFKSSAF